MLKKITLTASLCALTSVGHAINPVDGFYAGITIGGSYAPKATIDFIQPSNTATCVTADSCTSSRGRLTYDGFGSIGGQFGYRYNHIRVELEPTINHNPFRDIATATQTFEDRKTSPNLRIDGQTDTASIMLNGINDFYSDMGDNRFYPYAGIGIGYSNIHSKLKFFCNDQLIPCTEQSSSQGTGAEQGILGAAYAADDFTWFGIDARYYVSQNISSLNKRNEIYSINLSFTGSLQCLTG